MAAPGAELPPGSFDTRVPTVIGVIAFTLAVATITVCLRIYTRKYIINRMGIDDYFAILALVSLASLSNATRPPLTLNEYS